MKFDQDSVKSYLFYELDCKRQVKQTLKYLFEVFKKNGHHQKLDEINPDCKLKWNEGKSYHWTVISYEGGQILIRRYGQHFTLYFYYQKQIKEYKHSYLHIITYYIDTNKTENSDWYYDYPTKEFLGDLNQIIKTVHENYPMRFTDIKKEYLELKSIFKGETIYSYDQLFFALEELSNIWLESYAENDMFEMISKLKVGDDVGGNEVKEIHSEFDPKYGDGYYHAVGVLFEGETYKKDVYRLTRYHKDEIEELVRNR